MTTNGNEERPLPDGWKIATLEDVAHVERGITFPASAKQDEPFEDGIICLRTANVQKEVDWDDLLYVPYEYVKKDTKLLRENDILISMANSHALVGKVSFVPNVKEETSFGGFIVAIRANLKINPKFLFYHLRSSSTQSEMRRNSSQTVNIANLSLTRLYPTAIRLAPLPEQERIVAEIEKQFTRLDTAVATLNRLQANLDRYKASVLKAACEGRLVPQDPDAEPADQLLQRILVERRRQWEAQEWQNQIERAQKKVAQARRKAAGLPYYIRDLAPEDWQDIPESEYADYLPKNDKWKRKYKEPEGVETAVLPELPDGWVWASTDQISLRIVDCLHSTPKFQPSGCLCIDTNCIKPGRIIIEDARCVDEETFHERNRRMVPKVEDVLFSREGALLGVAVRVPEGIEFCLGQRMMVFRLSTEIQSKFFETVLNSLVFQNQYKAKITGTASPHLNIGDIRGFGVPIPPLAEQKRIVDEVERLLSVVDVTQKAITTNLTRAHRLRQSILQQAFTGQLV